MRKICVITGTRADYGLLSGLMQSLRDSEEFKLQVIASCMHLLPEFGNTYKEIERDGFSIDAKIPMYCAGDDAVSITKSVGLGVIGFADSLERLSPDLVVLLGDRFEALAAAQAAMFARIPIAHIHGGEITEGAVDESIRHAITKLSNLHFVSTEQFRERLLRMGELPDRVVVSGAPGIDNIAAINPMSRKEIEDSLGFTLGDKNILMTYHPVTLHEDRIDPALDNLLAVIGQLDQFRIIITFPNADEGHGRIIEALKQFESQNSSRVKLEQSLGYRRYLSLLRHVEMVVGNSSSGIIEVPSLGIPTVNIGDRQKGRVRADSVIDCGESSAEIESAISKAATDSFRELASHVVNPYGNGQAIEQMMLTLASVRFDDFVRKPFYDGPKG